MNQPKARPEVSCRHLGEEAVLFDSRTSTAHVINRTAAEVWELCDGSRTIEEVAAVLGERYPDARDQLTGDIVELVCAFEGKGLLDERTNGTEGDRTPGECLMPEGGGVS